METAVERRDPQQTRIPLDDVLVQIRHEDFEEVFEADGVNLGVGGLSMRSSILPDVGARLRCSFHSPHDGACVDADAEVVWADDTGPAFGQFGLRFTDLDTRDEDSIHRMIEAWAGALDESRPGTEPGDTPIRVKVKLDGVGQPVDAHVVHRSGEAMVLEQGLPFLRIGTGVTDDEGRRGELQAVDLRLEDETPRLVLTVWYDADAGALTMEDRTLVDADAPVAKKVVKTPPEPSNRETDEVLAREAESKQWAKKKLPRDEVNLEARRDSGEKATPKPEPKTAETTTPKERGDAPQLVRHEYDEDEELLLQSGAKAKLLAVKTKLAPLGARLKSWVLVAWARLGPFARTAWTKTRTLAAKARERSGPAMQRFVAKLKGIKGGGKRRQQRTPKRKTTRPAPKKSKGPAGRPAEPERPRKRRGRVVVAAVVMVVVGAGVNALLAEERPVVIKTMAKPGAVYPSSVPEDPEAGDDAPSLEGAARPASEPGTVPVDSPYAAEPSAPSSPTPGALAYGAESVPQAREFRIRLSATPEALSGERTGDGFEVRLTGARALDGARRIATVMSRVRGAGIQNEGSDAVLTLRFVGEPPAYRVEASGESLVIQIGH